MKNPDHEVLIVGAGFSGIGSAIMLDKAGFGDYQIIEAGTGPGGTWFWNTYPGIAVDIPSFSYQFSFEQNPNWSRTYAPGHELRAYADHCVDKYGLRPKIRFNTAVRDAVFDEDNEFWCLELDSGEVLTGRFLINGSGILTTPNLPDIDGVDSFAGAMIHTARWDHTQDLAGKRVAIIGTGASAVQLIPEIAPIVQRLTVFQRTPIWCFPKADRPLSARQRVAMQIPGVKSVQRLVSQAYVELTFPLVTHYFTVNPTVKHMAQAGKAYLRRQVRDPEVRDKLTPRYAVGCKRPAFHNAYLSTFNRDNVELVTTPIEKITGSSVVVTDGSHDVDVLILATGFKVLDPDELPTYPIAGVGGRRLAEFWNTHRLQAYQGVSVPGFPNFFTVFGPYGFVGSSYFALIEAQTHHIVRCLKHARRKRATRVEITREASDRFFASMLHKRRRQIFWQDSCKQSNSYYFDKHGDVPLRPASTPEVYWHSRRFPLADYRFSAAMPSVSGKQL
ncbi:flavin-containing monooxygenase [Mycolicibacterium sp. Dal123E01]|uniref:flavin-containing monooxygenase n=1 Tax=Mycolicibacterium sp. Dal123E01 TaxID=3457578 RepID=UPI00403EAABB